MTDNSNTFLINDQYYGVSKLGEGGFGTVWKVYDFSLKNFVAIKELLPQYSESKFIEMFYKEALIAKHLIHDNIVRVQHFWQGSNGSFYILMDYVPGCDLQRFLSVCKKKNLAVPIELHVFIIGSALKAIYHANKQAKDPITCKPYEIVYRDFSPGNIMLSFDGNVKVSDFGIAQTSADQQQENRTRVITGKYAYMSPEQVKGELNLDHRSDIFTAGIVLYEVMAGRPLFTGEPADIKKQILEFKFDAKQMPDQHLPHEIYEVLEKALSPEKELRYQSALEMFRDLCRLLKGKYSEELTVDLSKFLATTLEDEYNQNQVDNEKIKVTTLQDARLIPGIRKLTCRDFIPGATSAVQNHQSAPRTTSYANPTHRDTDDQHSSSSFGMPPENEFKGEEKGKTVFEEVGDWIITNLKSYKTMVVRVMLALFFTAVLYTAADTLFRITPFGKHLYSRIYPPDAVIETTPPGARVTMKTRSGGVIIDNADSIEPIELRKIPAQSYIVEATKDGFKPVNRVVTIEEKHSGSDNVRQRIVIPFYYALNVNSVPAGADIFINGNNMGKTPWKGELSAGEHTIKIAMAGYEDLGSNAKEQKEGMCNIDFSQNNDAAIFRGVDSRFWENKIEEMDDINVYNISGFLFKKFNIDSNPKNVIVHVDSESKPRGNTPLTLSMRSGDYKLRFIDPSGKYKETSQSLKVAPDSSPDIFVTLPKWVTISVRARDNRKDYVNGSVQIVGEKTKSYGDISSDKPLRTAVLPGNYTLIFSGGEKFKPLALHGVNFAENTAATGELEYIESVLKVTVAEGVHDNPIPNTFVWIDNKIAGNTNAQGSWEGKVKYGKHIIKIVAKGYIEQSIERMFDAEKSVRLPFAMKPEEPEPLMMDGSEQLPDSPDPVRRVGKSTSTALGAALEATGRALTPPGARKPILLIEDKEEDPTVEPAKADSGVSPETNVTVCPYCGTKYYDKRKRTFCINCGKPLK